LDAISLVLPIFAVTKILCGLLKVYLGDYSNMLRELSKYSSKACLNWTEIFSNDSKFKFPLGSTNFQGEFLKDFILLLLGGMIYMLLILFILHVNNLSKIYSNQLKEE